MLNKFSILCNEPFLFRSMITYNTNYIIYIDKNKKRRNKLDIKNNTVFCAYYIFSNKKKNRKIIFRLMKN